MPEPLVAKIDKVKTEVLLGAKEDPRDREVTSQARTTFSHHEQ